MDNAKWTFERSKVDSRYTIGSGCEELTTHKSGTESPFGGQQERLSEMHGFVKLLSILDTRRGFQASDSRDRLFAHLGLVENINLGADYGMNCKQVFELFAESYIKATATHDIFKHIEDKDLRHRMRGLATLAPDWSHREDNPRRRPLPMETAQSLKLFLNFKDSTLTTNATRFSSISILSPMLDTSLYQSSSHDRAWDACEWMARSIGCPTILLMDHMHRYPENDGDLIALLVQGLHEHHQTHGSILDGRRLAILDDESGGFALVPGCSERGDHIYHPLDSFFPLVVRDAGLASKSGPEAGHTDSHGVYMIGVGIIETYVYSSAKPMRRSSEICITIY
jgi:hypothetical protein